MTALTNSQGLKSLLLGIATVVLLTANSGAVEKKRGFVPTQDKLRALGHMESLDAKMRYGFGFLLGDSSTIVTVAHVALSDTMLFSGPISKRKDTITLIFKDTNFDVAVFKASSPLPIAPFEFGKFNETRIGDTVTYIMWNSFKYIDILKRPIELILADSIGGEFVEFLRMKRGGSPGTSGSPVFDYTGKVVAVISMGREDSINRTMTEALACSLKPLYRIIKSE